MVADPADPVVPEFEKSAYSQLVGLTICYRQIVVGSQIGALEHELGCAMGGICIEHEHRIDDLFAVTGFHMGQEFTEFILALPGCALTWFVQYIISQQLKHALIITGIEGLVVGFQYFFHEYSICKKGTDLKEVCLVSQFMGSFSI